ncbi:hypothetical protein [Ignatzschineria sp. F8392]|nr:hypothetical protein [Ignatzschineria sp. F8392]
MPDLTPARFHQSRAGSGHQRYQTAACTSKKNAMVGSRHSTASLKNHL